MEYCARCGHKFEKNDLMYEQFIQDEKTNRPIWSGKYICDECGSDESRGNGKRVLLHTE